VEMSPALSTAEPAAPATVTPADAAPAASRFANAAPARARAASEPVAQTARADSADSRDAAASKNIGPDMAGRAELPATPGSASGAAPSPLPLEYRATPARWLARIIELREHHEDARADEELAQFRRSHPGQAIPERALRP